MSRSDKYLIRWVSYYNRVSLCRRLKQVYGPAELERRRKKKKRKRPARNTDRVRHSTRRALSRAFQNAMIVE